MQFQPSDELEQFLGWWLNARPFSPPPPDIDSTVFDGKLSGAVLYRDAEYQVQLFMVQPNSEIADHIHPNCDSFEVYLSGDIDFRINGESVRQDMPIRVRPEDWHGGSFGERGGCFLSVQRWLHGQSPSSVGADWMDKDGNTHGCAS